MKELTEREARQLAGAMRPNRKPLWIAVGVNVMMAVLLLGVPYWRGRMLAQAERADFVAFARCMFGGETASEPGLSLPRGEREHYAAKVLYANRDWPVSCRPPLKRLQPPNATFLWPSVKTAGADLRAAVDLVDRELVTLAKRRTQAPGRVPQRPLDAIKRLQAASVLFARAADASQHADNDALVLSPEVRELASPARLPLMLGESLGMKAWSDAGTLEVLGLDSHSLAYLRVENGKVDRQRARKNAFVRGVARAGDTAYVVSAMPETRCAEREDGCVGRPTGLSRFDKGSSELSEPSWRLEGHPAERLDRALLVSEMGRVDLLARAGKDGAIDLLRARLPVELPGAAAAERKPTWLEPEIVTIVPPLPAAQGKSGAKGSPSAGASAPPAAAPSTGATASATAANTGPAHDAANAGAAEHNAAPTHGANTGAVPDASTANSSAAASAPAAPNALNAGAANSAAATRMDKSMPGANAASGADGPSSAPTKPGAAPSPAAPSSPVRHTTATLLAGEPLGVLRAVDGAEHVEAALVLAGASVQTLALPPAAGSGGWVTACGAGAARWLAYGSSEELHVARVEGSALTPLTAAAVELEQPIDPSDGARDRLLLLCTEQLARVLFVDRGRVLREVTCTPALCGAPQELAPQVQQLSAVQRDDVSVLSYYEGPLAPTIKLLRLDAVGKPLGPAVVAGSCWEPLGGLCGSSKLIGDAQRLALLTRDGPDLLVLESTNTGRSWGALSGFQQRSPLGSGSDPMQQHRLKKGLSE